MKPILLPSHAFRHVLALLFAAGALCHPARGAEPAASEEAPKDQSGPIAPVRPVCVECDVIRLPLADAARLVMSPAGEQQTTLHAQATALIRTGSARRVSYQSATVRDGGRGRMSGLVDEPWQLEWRLSGDDGRTAWRADAWEFDMCGYQLEFDPSLSAVDGTVGLNIVIESDRQLSPQQWQTAHGTVEAMRRLSCDFSGPGRLPAGVWRLQCIMGDEPLPSRAPGVAQPEAADSNPSSTLVFLRATPGPGPVPKAHPVVPACTVRGELLIADLATVTAALAGLNTLTDGPVIRDRLSAAAEAAPDRVRIGSLFVLPVDHGQGALQRTECDVSWPTQYADLDALRDEARRQHLMEGKTPLPVPPPPAAEPEGRSLVLMTNGTGVSLEVAVTRLPDTGDWLVKHDLWLGHVPGVEKVNPSDTDPLAPVEAISRELTATATARKKPGTLWLAGMRQMQDQSGASSQVVLLFLRLTEEMLP